MPWPEHIVHRIGEALCALVTIRIVCGVHTAEAQKRLLENEGFIVRQKGKRYFVPNYQNYLADFEA
jgi:hypothetical protein